MRKFGKWTVAVIVALLCVMMVGVASAGFSGTCGAEGEGDNVVWTVDDEGVLTISGTGAMADLPSSRWDLYDVKTVQILSGVTHIGSNAFSFCHSIESVTMADSVTSIGDNAFYYCSGLTSVKFSSNLTSIGEEAFDNCAALASMTLPASLTSIGGNAFAGCQSLETVVIPQGLTSMGVRAFTRCGGLRSVTINADFDEIEWGVEAFTWTGTAGSPLSVTFGDSVTYIASELFQLSNVTEVTIGKNVKTIGDYVFSQCEHLSKVTFARGSVLTTINDGAFYDNKSLTSIDLPETVSTIGEYAFKGCGLTSLTLPAAVTYVDFEAFASLSSLTTLTINAKNAFYAKNSIDADTVTSLTINGNMRFDETPLYGPIRPATVTFGDDVTTIPSHLFRTACIKELNIGKGVTTIEAYAFDECTVYGSLNSITVPANVKSIGAYAFHFAELKDVTIYNPDCALTAGFIYSWSDSTDHIIGYGDTTIIGYVGSTAEKYAKKYDFRFVPLEGEAPSTPGAQLDTPELSSVTNTAKGVTIKWGKVTGAEKYRVYYKTTGKWKKLTDTKSTSYTWTKAQSGMKYTFTVKCMSADGKTATSEYDKTGKSITYFAQPKLSSVKNTATGVTIKWGKVTGAAKYRVYYKTTGGWKKLTETKSTSYTWTKAQSGMKYSFTVASLSSTGKTASAYDTTGKSITYLAQPKVSSVKNVEGGVTIKWGKVNGAAQYRVYYKTTGSWKKLTDTKSTSYTWKKAKSGTKYSFTVQSLSSTGKTVSTYDTTGKSITYVAAPKLSSVKASGTSVTIKWGKVTGATKYRVYYKTTGGWKKLTETTKTSYTWKKAKSGVKYTFTVCCIDSKGNATSAYDTKGKAVTIK